MGAVPGNTSFVIGIKLKQIETSLARKHNIYCDYLPKSANNCCYLYVPASTPKPISFSQTR